MLSTELVLMLKSTTLQNYLFSFNLLYSCKSFMVVARLYPPSVSQLVDHRQTDVFNKFCKLVCSLLLMKQYPTLPFIPRYKNLKAMSNSSLPIH